MTPKQLSRLLDYWATLDAWERKVAPQFDPDTWRFVDLARVLPHLKRKLLKISRIKEPAQRLFSQDPMKLRRRFEPLEKRLCDDVHFLKSVQTHAELGIPTLHYERGKADSAADLSPQMFSSLPQEVSSVIRLYFHNVKAPHAETLRDALRLRDNPSIAEWRKQVFRWTQELEADRINLIEIKRQIEGKPPGKAA